MKSEAQAHADAGTGRLRLQRRPGSAARHRAADRGRRVPLPGPLQRLRQDQPARSPPACCCRAAARSTDVANRCAALARGRLRVPAPDPARLAQRARQRAATDLAGPARQGPRPRAGPALAGPGWAGAARAASPSQLSGGPAEPGRGGARLDAAARAVLHGRAFAAPFDALTREELRRTCWRSAPNRAAPCCS